MARNKHRGEYPASWPEIAARVKEAAGWRCERCGHPNEPPWKNSAYSYRVEAAACDERCRHPQDGKQRMLTVHHLTNDKSNCQTWNLAALCQVCHLVIQGRVEMAQFWMFEHSDWMKPHVEGYYKSHGLAV